MIKGFTPRGPPTRFLTPRILLSAGSSTACPISKKIYFKLMSKSRLEWKVGLFVLISSALLAGVLLQFSKGTSLFKPTYNILLRASNVGGLKPKASVLMAGVQIGTVADIKLGPQGTNVTITLRIYEQYQIHKDARFVIEQSGFLGDQFVAIMPTANAPGVFHDQDVAESEAPFNLQEV